MCCRLVGWQLDHVCVQAGSPRQTEGSASTAQYEYGQEVRLSQQGQRSATDISHRKGNLDQVQLSHIIMKSVMMQCLLGANLIWVWYYKFLCQSIHQSVTQSVSQSDSQSVNQSESINHISVNQPINQSSANQSVSQSSVNKSVSHQST